MNLQNIQSTFNHYVGQISFPKIQGNFITARVAGFALAAFGALLALTYVAYSLAGRAVKKPQIIEFGPTAVGYSIQSDGKIGLKATEQLAFLEADQKENGSYRLEELIHEKGHFRLGYIQKHEIKLESLMMVLEKFKDHNELYIIVPHQPKLNRFEADEEAFAYDHNRNEVSERQFNPKQSHRLASYEHGVYFNLIFDSDKLDDISLSYNESGFLILRC